MLPPRIPSNEHLEYQIVSVACSGVNPGVVQVSGFGAPKTLDLSGVTTYGGENNANFIPSHVIPIGPNAFLPVLAPWEQVSNPNMHIFVRIDGATAAVVTLKQRVKILQRIPAPFVTNHPASPQDTHLEREQRILDAVYGAEGELIAYGKHPAQRGTVRELATADPPYPGQSFWGPIRRGG